jgi:hypothetical protein
VKRNNHAAFKRYAKQHNKNEAPHRIAIGDQVLVKNVITKKGISRKIFPLWTGPYEVVGRTGPSTIRIRRGSNIVSMHANRLKLWENSNSDINSVRISANRAVAETATGEKLTPAEGKEDGRGVVRITFGSQPRAAQVAAARTRTPAATRYNLRPRS